MQSRAMSIIYETTGARHHHPDPELDRRQYEYRARVRRTGGGAERVRVRESLGRSAGRAGVWPFGSPERQGKSTLANRNSMGVVGRDDLAYVRTEQASGREMPQTTRLRLSPVPRPVIAAGAVFGVLVATALALWGYYGSAVFFETIAAGIAACL